MHGRLLAKPSSHASSRKAELSTLEKFQDVFDGNSTTAASDRELPSAFSYHALGEKRRLFGQAVCCYAMELFVFR